MVEKWIEKSSEVIWMIDAVLIKDGRRVQANEIKLLEQNQSRSLSDRQIKIEVFRRSIEGSAERREIPRQSEVRIFIEKETWGHKSSYN